MQARKFFFLLKLHHLIGFSKLPNICTFPNLFERWHKLTSRSTVKVHHLNIIKLRHPFDHHHHRLAIHPSSASTWMCVGCSPGSWMWCSSGLSNIYEGLLNSAMAALLGQTAPGPVLSIPINETEVRYTHFSAERRQLIFFFFFLFPILPWSWSSLPLGLHYTHLFTWLCTGGDRGMEESAPVCIYLCVCVSPCTGCSQWSKLEVIIMYRLVCRDANANAFSVAAVWGLSAVLAGLLLLSN